MVARGGGKGEMGSYCLMSTGVSLLQDEKSSGGELHSIVNVLNITELYT